jgi:hypothetical protein
MTRAERDRLEHTTHCRCGCLWGEHKTEWSVDNMKLDCVMCGNPIGYTRKAGFVANQYPSRYKDKGNFCDKCNNQCGKASHRSSDSSEFKNMFKNKLK